MSSPSSTRRTPGLPSTVVVLALSWFLVAAALTAACGGTSTAESLSSSPAASGVAFVAASPSTGADTVDGSTVDTDAVDADTIVYVKGSISGPESGNLVDEHGVFRVRSDGSHREELAPEGFHPAWSPDGTKIAYAVGYDGVYVMNADGSDQRLVASDAKWSGGLAWSPDGTQIVVSTYVSPDVAHLCIINADGSGSRELTPAGEAVMVDSDPAWSPDGRIYFIRWQQQPVKEGPDGEIVEGEGDVTREQHICRVNPDGTGMVVITAAYDAFSLSPDGKWLVFTDMRSADLVRVASDGQGTRTVVVESVLDYAPPQAFFTPATSWSPDGTKIVFAGHQSPFLAPGYLYTVDADGGSKPRRIPHTGLGFDPVWQPR